jgi:hypothetical protein
MVILLDWEVAEIGTFTRAGLASSSSKLKKALGVFEVLEESWVCLWKNPEGKLGWRPSAYGVSTRDLKRFDIILIRIMVGSSLKRQC